MKSTFHCFLCLILTLSLAGSLFAQGESASSVTSVEHVSSSRENNVFRWKTSNGASSFNIELRGKIELSDDDKDVVSMSNDGYLEISKTVFGSKRKIIIESLGGGKLSREYYEGRTKMDWETAGKSWLAEILPEVVKTTTIGAEGRVDRFYAKGGAKAVLAQIQTMESDYVKAHYGKLLLAKNIPNAEIPGVIASLSNEIHSDYYLSTLLKDNVGKLLATEQSADAFFHGADKISSAYYKSVVLKEALVKYAASPAQVKVILKSSSTISSDYYLSTVLTTLLDQKEMKEESLNELLVVSKNIPSDYYRSVVLNKAIEKPGISKAALKSMVESAKGISSDYYQTSVYNNMAEHASLDPDIQIQIITQIGEVNSDYYSSVSLKNMVEHQKLTDESLNKLIEVASHNNSAYYGKEVLSAVASQNLSKAQILSYLKAAVNINSDSYLADALRDVADQVKKSDDQVKAAYRAAAKEIKSETYYGRTLRALED